MNRKKPRPLHVEVPKPERDKPAWSRVGVVAVVGLVVGVLWPRLAGVNVGPEVPGANKPRPTATVPAVVLPQAASSANAVLAATAAVPKTSNQQLVVVSEGTIAKCWHKSEQLKTAQCGALRIDRLLVPRLQQLATCPSALGLAGKLQLGFDLQFGKKKKNEIRVIRGRDKSDLPSSTVRGIMTCIADYLRDVSPEKIRHKYSKYRVYYSLTFYPPGTRPAADPADGTDEDGGTDSPDTQSVASVTWDTALVRDEPRTGKVLARLVRGTRVKLLGKRKDWYRVRIRTKEGWVYRGAIGL